MASKEKLIRRSAVMMGGSAVLLSFAPSVLAQAIEDVTRLEPVTVEGNRLYEMLSSEATGGYSVDAATVGTKTPASLRDIPQSVSVVTHEAIEDQNFTTLDELGRRTPGMRVLTNDNGRSSIYARGYEYDEYSIDGLPAPMTSITGSVPTLAAFDRVEIMRGPSGLFDSTSEMGGIVNLVRKRPTEDFQGHVNGSLGSDHQRSAQVDLSGPIATKGRVRGRLVIDHTEHNQFVDHNENDQNDIYAALDIDLDEATTLGLGYIHNTKDIAVNNGHPVGSDGELLYGSRADFYGADWNDFNSQPIGLIPAAMAAWRRVIRIVMLTIITPSVEVHWMPTIPSRWRVPLALLISRRWRWMQATASRFQRLVTLANSSWVVITNALIPKRSQAARVAWRVGV